MYSRNVSKTTFSNKFNNNFYIVHLKNHILPALFLLFTLCLIIFSQSNIPVVTKAINLWITSVVPALLPFFIATELLMHTNLTSNLGNLLDKPMKFLFNVDGKGGFALIMGIISGYPVGAKIASEFRINKICSKEDCERLLSFTNNSGPLFIIGTVGIVMFGNSTIGFLLFLTHLMGSLTTGFIFRFWRTHRSPEETYSNPKYVHFKDLGTILTESISNGISTILLIGGFIIIFSIIINILNQTGFLDFFTYIFKSLFEIIGLKEDFTSAIITGLFEITNGIQLISNIPNKKLSINIIITAFLLGLGGLSIFLQVLSITSKTDLSIKPYIIGKLLHSIFASIYTYIFLNFIPFFYLDL